MIMQFLFAPVWLGPIDINFDIKGWHFCLAKKSCLWISQTVIE